MSAFLKLKCFPIFLFVSVLVLTGCDDSDEGITIEPPTILFDSATLPGTYHMTFENEPGVHVYTFNANGKVLINYADGTTDEENWSVNAIGQLVIQGTVDDLFSLTSGTQASGELLVLLRDADSDEPDEPMTGTIELQ